MTVKFAFISKRDPREDFMFTIELPSTEEIDLFADDVNKNLTDGKVEYVSIELKRGKHEVSQY